MKAMRGFRKTAVLVYPVYFLQAYIASFALLQALSLIITMRFVQLVFVTLITAIALTLLFIKKGVKHSAKIVSLSLPLIYVLSHFMMSYLFIPSSSLSDARVFFINTIIENGRISALEKYSQPEGSYYTLYPSIWLISSFLKLVTNVDEHTALFSTHSLSYINILLMFYSFVMKCNGKIPFHSLVIPALIVSSSYLMQITQLMVSADILGVLGCTLLLIISYDIISHMPSRSTVILSLLIIPLLISHPIALLVAFLFLVLVIVNVEGVARRRLSNLLLRIFIGSWIYLSEILLPTIKYGGFYHFLVILASFINRIVKNPGLNIILERGEGLSIIEQSRQLIYPYHSIIFWLYYVIPSMIGLCLVVIQLWKDLALLANEEKRENKALFDLALFQLQMLLLMVVGFFGYKGIENAIARYAFIYQNGFNLLIISKAVKEGKGEHNDAKGGVFIIVIALALLLYFHVINLHPFYSPWTSLYDVPDIYQLKRIISP